MSGFAVTYHRGRAPLPAETLPAILAALEHRGPDGVDATSEPPFALGHRHFWTTPEEAGERQPLADEEAGLSIVLDGRLDNRDELLEALVELRQESRDLSDARIVLAAYRRWGRDCFRRFLGPFAIVVCDRKNGVVCARDPLGDRSLYYRIESGSLLVASEEQALLAVPGVSRAFDESRLAQYFAVRVPDDGSTFFNEIAELRPGHLLRVDAESCNVERYHRIAVPEPIHCRDDGEYAERYRELLGEAVRCRLRSTTPSAVMMSGGLDSTPLVAVAAAGGAADVVPVSWVFDELESCDERRFMDPVLNRYGLEAIRFSGDGHWPLRYPELYGANPNGPEENAYRGLKRHLYRSVAADGCRVVLNGGSADLLYFGYQHWLGDLLREGKLGEAAVGSWREMQRRGPGSAAGALLRRLRRLGLSRRSSGSRAPSAPWLTPEARRWVPESGSAPWLDFQRPAQCRNVFGARQAHSLAREVFHANREGVDLRHPYRDRRLIDFMLAIPAHQLYRRGKFKPMVRQAMRELLPAVILERSDRTLLTPLFERGLWSREAKRVREILGCADAVWPRYVRREWLERVRQGGARRPVDGVVLWLCVAFELWRRPRGGP